MRRQISILLAALLVLTLLVGCGGSGSAKPAATGYAYDTDASTAPEAPMEQDSKFNITAVVADDTAHHRLLNQRSGHQQSRAVLRRLL